MNAPRRIAILGDMLELGSFEEEGHRLVGRHTAGIVAKLIAVGPRARWIAEEARAAGLSDVSTLDKSTDNPNLDIQNGDVVLVKGSRGVRMEEIVRQIAPSGAGTKAPPNEHRGDPGHSFR